MIMGMHEIFGMPWASVTLDSKENFKTKTINDFNNNKKYFTLEAGMFVGYLSHLEQQHLNETFDPGVHF